MGQGEKGGGAAREGSRYGEDKGDMGKGKKGLIESTW